MKKLLTFIFLVLFSVNAYAVESFTRSPIYTDDNTKGYKVGSEWLNKTTGIKFTCIGATTNGALWRSNDGSIQSSSYSTINGAVAAAGGINGTLILNSTLTTTGTALTIPATLKIKCEPGGLIRFDSSTQTLTINSVFDPGTQQVFSDTAATPNYTKGIVFGSGVASKIHPEWWGALGNGSANDSLAIKSALANGGKIILSSGKTYMAVDVDLTSNSYLTGGGALMTVAGTVMGESHYLLRANGINNVIVDNIILDGNIDHVDGTTEIGTAIFIIINSNNTTIQNSTLRNNNYLSIAVEDGSYNIKIDGNTIINTDCGVIFMGVGSPVHNVRITRNHIRNTTSESISLFMATGSEAYDIVIADNVIGSDTTDTTALTGTASSSGTAVTGINTLFTTELYVGEVIGNTTIGWRVVTVITSNTALTLNAAFPVTASGSTIYGSTSAGAVLMKNAHHVTITGNSFDKNGYGIYSIAGASNISIVGNVFIRGRSAVYGLLTNSTISGNTISGQLQGGIDLGLAYSGTTNVVISGNNVSNVNVSGSSFHAIRLIDATNCLIIGNRTFDTRTPVVMYGGITISGASSSGNVIQYNYCTDSTYQILIQENVTGTIVRDNIGIVIDQGTASLILNIHFFGYGKSVEDDGIIILPAFTANGYGRIVVGTAGTTYASFISSSTGAITLLTDTSADVVANADTDAKICVGTASPQEPIQIKNRLGSSQTLNVMFWYY